MRINIPIIVQISVILKENIELNAVAELSNYNFMKSKFEVMVIR